MYIRTSMRFVIHLFMCWLRDFLTGCIPNRMQSCIVHKDFHRICCSFIHVSVKKGLWTGSQFYLLGRFILHLYMKVVWYNQSHTPQGMCTTTIILFKIWCVHDAWSRNFNILHNNYNFPLFGHKVANAW